jgi:threonine aldolase
MIDLRSDTVTQPTNEMRERMFSSIVGDDVLQEDPTVIELQQRVAAMFKKEDALFFPSGTMSNLTAIISWCGKRGSEVIVGDKSHIFLYEQSGASQFGGVSFRTVTNLKNGTMDIQNIIHAIREDDIHEPTTELICIENTHNVCGGTVLPMSYLKQLNILSDQYGIPIHLDGARIWNAITAVEIEPHHISKYVDSLTVCLSKGLGGPMGSLLIGKKEFIKNARRIRKALGGGMRQIGMMAAAGLQALDDFENNILLKDHLLTKQLAEGLLDIPYLKIDYSLVQTNIIFAKVESDVIDAPYISRLCKEHQILISSWDKYLLRFVVHRDIDADDIQKVIDVLLQINYIIAD